MPTTLADVCATFKFRVPDYPISLDAEPMSFDEFYLAVTLHHEDEPTERVRAAYHLFENGPWTNLNRQTFAEAVLTRPWASFAQVLDAWFDYHGAYGCHLRAGADADYTETIYQLDAADDGDIDPDHPLSRMMAEMKRPQGNRRPLPADVLERIARNSLRSTSTAR